MRVLYGLLNAPPSVVQLPDDVRVQLAPAVGLSGDMRGEATGSPPPFGFVPVGGDTVE